jgi:hypothetical protein
MDCNHNREWDWLGKLALINISATLSTTRKARLRATLTR